MKSIMFKELICIWMLLIAASMISCSGKSSGKSDSDSVSDSDITAPTVILTVPGDGYTTKGILIGDITATFSEEMDSSTIDSPSVTFTLKEQGGVSNLAGNVSYAADVATFNPDVDLTANTTYTATITVAATDINGNPMTVSKIWNFTTVVLFPNPEAVNLGLAGTFTIFGDAGISTIPTSIITGDIGTTSAATYLTGFALSAAGRYSMSTQVVGGGRVYAINYVSPTPGDVINASNAIGNAYTISAGLAADATELFAGNLTGKTLPRGVYKWTTNVHSDIDNVTLCGDATDRWVFITSNEVILTGGAKVILSGGALAKNVFWISADTVTLEANTLLEGIVLGKKGIVLKNGATVNGRLFSQTAVTLIANTITEPL